jgi:hypothetical protein
MCLAAAASPLIALAVFEGIFDVMVLRARDFRLGNPESVREVDYVLQDIDLVSRLGKILMAASVMNTGLA